MASGRFWTMSFLSGVHITLLGGLCLPQASRDLLSWGLLTSGVQAQDLFTCTRGHSAATLQRQDEGMMPMAAVLGRCQLPERRGRGCETQPRGAGRARGCEPQGLCQRRRQCCLHRCDPGITSTSASLAAPGDSKSDTPEILPEENSFLLREREVCGLHPDS